MAPRRFAGVKFAARAVSPQLRYRGYVARCVFHIDHHLADPRSVATPLARAAVSMAVADLAVRGQVLVVVIDRRRPEFETVQRRHLQHS